MQLPCHVIGHGPHNVLVLHGWFGDERFLEPLRPALDTEACTFACVAYRGYGAALHLSGGHTLAEIASDARDTADGLGWHRFDVVGHSMGGKVALKLMVLAPDRVRRIVALTPVPAHAVPFDTAAWSLFSGAARNIAKRREIIDFSTAGRLGAHWVRRLAQNSWARSRPEAFAAYLQAWALEDFSADLAGHSTPLLALVGAHDPSLTAELMRATTLAALPSARVDTLPAAGRYPIDEVPLLTGSAVQQFLLDGCADR